MPRKRKAGRPRKKPAETATREKILRVARKFFAENGYHQTSLDQVAAAIDIRVPSLLYHFPSKQKLYESVVTELMTEVARVLDEVYAVEGEAGERFQKALNLLVQFEKRESAIIPIVLADSFTMGSPGQKILAEAIAPLLDRAEEYFRKHIAPPVSPKAPLREVMVMVLLSYASRMGLGEAGKKIWGPEDHSIAIGITLLQGLQKWPAK